MVSGDTFPSNILDESKDGAESPKKKMASGPVQERRVDRLKMFDSIVYNP